ncbi:alpha/beta fold hydrolase [Bradyrhizobium commune]|uniref:Alpha/beta fold hydrolase n=1 Tax=Bradyrhizobium commune TaxID=83627 RepID=A0A7S9DB83_9BRAD|nr:acyl carrier protein [Bradyrhizobium commune]QPF94557.1 alpha/beta fold hydrolase [Bradyrhizobium commune]
MSDAMTPNAQLGSASIEQSPSILETVLDIWQRTTGPKGQQPNADLRHIGIGVRRVVRLLDEIEEALGKRIPIGTALRLGTPDAIAEAIATDRWPEPSPLLLLKDGDDRPPLYLIAGVRGTLFEVVALARASSFPGKIWGLQPPGFEGDAPRFESIEATAAEFLEHLVGDRAAPVNLVGYSMGGEIAIEMARALRSDNRKLGLIGLIDTNVVERHWSLTTRLRYAARRSQLRVFGLFQAPSGQRLDNLLNIVRPLIRRLIGQFTYDAEFTRYYESGLDDRIKVVKDLALVAYERYVPPVVDFPVVLFKSWESAKRDLVDPVETWRPKIPELEVVEVDGTHANMIFPPFVRGLASEIAARLL